MKSLKTYINEYQNLNYKEISEKLILGKKIASSNIKKKIELESVTQLRQIIFERIQDAIKNKAFTVDLNDIDISSLGDVVSFINLFSVDGISQIIKIKIDQWETNNVNDFSYMFRGAQKLESLNLTYWDVSNGANFNGMFDTCTNLKTIGDISTWKTPKAKYMENMFNNCVSLAFVDISNFVVNQLCTCKNMFNNCWKLKSIGKLDNWQITNNCTKTSHMFNGCRKLKYIGDISKWDISLITHLDHMFNECQSLTYIGNIEDWDIMSCTDLTCFMNNCKSLKDVGNLNKWKTKHIKKIKLLNAFKNTSIAPDWSLDKSYTLAK